MLVFNCTKLAADFFSVTQRGKKISPIEPAPKCTIAQSLNDNAGQTPSDLTSYLDTSIQWHWLVHAIKVKGKSVLVVMDCKSRFSITLTGIKKGDDMAFLNAFEHHLTAHVHEIMALASANIDAIDDSLERYYQQHNSCKFYQRGDASVQAHINDVIWHFRSVADEQRTLPSGVDLITHDVFVNKLLRKRKAEKKYFEPQYEFLFGWLKQYGQYNSAQTDQYMEYYRAKERATFAAKYPGLAQGNRAPNNSVAGISSDADNVISLDTYRKKS